MSYQRESGEFVSGPSQERLRAEFLNEPVGPTVNRPFYSTAELREFMEAKLLSESPIASEYARYGTGASLECERILANLEGGDSALVFCDGMTAISHTLLALLGGRRTPGHCIVADQCYRQMLKVVERLRRLHVLESYAVVPAGDIAAIECAVLPEKTRFIFLESPTNPKLWITDFEALAAIGRRHSIPTIVDATLGALSQRPLHAGISIVIHSATKYLNGYNDLLAGAVIGSENYVSLVKEVRDSWGGILQEPAAALLVQRLPSLKTRVRFQNDNALAIAQRLEDHPLVERVWYPGLRSHPHHNLAIRQMPEGCGGVVTFELRGTEADSYFFLDQLAPEIPQAASLGGVWTIIESVKLMSHYMADDSELERHGVCSRTLRLSCGIEETATIWSVIERGLERLRQRSGSRA